MPSPEDAIREFQSGVESSLARETNREKVTQKLIETNVMVQGLNDLKDETDPAKLRAKAYELMRNESGNPALGSTVCSILLSKGEDGLQAAHQVSKAIMRHEISQYSPDGGGFLRGTHTINGFSKQFISETSPDCEKNVEQSIEQLKKTHDVDGVAKNGTREQQRDTTIALGKDMVNLLANPPVTEETMKYLKGLREAIEEDETVVPKLITCKTPRTQEQAEREKQEFGEIVVNNATSLRFTSPKLSQDELFSKEKRNEIWVDATKASQQTFSKAKSETVSPKPPHSDLDTNNQKKVLSKKELEENEDFVAVQHGVHESRGKVMELHEKVDKSVAVEDPSTDLGKQFGESLKENEKRQQQRLETATDSPEVAEQVENVVTRAETAKKLDSDRRAATKNLESAKPEMEKIEALEKKLDALNKPYSFERFKSYFSGGPEKAKEKVMAEIDKNKMEVFRKTEPEKFEQLQKVNKDTIAQLEIEQMGVAKGALDHELAKFNLEQAEKTLAVSRTLKDNNMPQVDGPERLQEAAKQKVDAEATIKATKQQSTEFEQHGKEIEGLKKNVSVRESLGKKPETSVKQDAPKVTMKV